MTAGRTTEQTRPQIVTREVASYLAADGTGAPGSPQHLAAISQLMAVVTDSGNSPVLEGLWWVDDDRPPLEVPREEWRWRLLVGLDGSENVDLAPPVHVVRLDEGTCIEAMHVGDYADEPRTLAAMDELMHEQDLEMAGRHHEIYLDDESVPLDRRRTLLRHPVRPVRR